MRPKVLAVVQARLGSTRLPGKTLAEVAGRPMLAHVIDRVRAIKGVDRVVLATTINPQDDRLVQFAEAIGMGWVRGSEEDVLDRFHLALETSAAEAILRVTPDCPLLDPIVSGLVVQEYLSRLGTVDYVSNIHPPTYPDGLDTEIFSASALVRAWREARFASEREHVTAFIWKHPEWFRLANVACDECLSHHRWVVDTASDLEFVRTVFQNLSADGQRPFGMHEVLNLLRTRPEISALNAGQGRNEGYWRSVSADAVSNPLPGRGGVG